MKRRIPFLEWVDKMSRSLRGLRTLTGLFAVLLFWLLLIIFGLWTDDLGYRTVQAYGVFAGVQIGGDAKNVIMHRSQRRQSDDAPPTQ